ncbi:hypothetical protein COO60DRAFT_602401 [Scenedesmus sp. NREL 46B-D3]|nr:hypothetical protein COO60DRAFT_602401 [Scenedesmus sp. NREL 46B-D3]
MLMTPCPRVMPKGLSVLRTSICVACLAISACVVACASCAMFGGLVRLGSHCRLRIQQQQQQRQHTPAVMRTRLHTNHHCTNHACLRSLAGACAQAQQALAAAQQAAAAAPAKPVDGYVPTRFISDVFCTAAPATPSAAAAGGGLSPLSGCSLAYLGVDREEELSCVAGGGPHLAVPEPEFAAGDLLALTTSWVENNGAVVECEEGVEVSPLVSYAGEGLDTIAGEGVVFTEPYDLALQGATGQGKPKHNAGPWAAPVLAAYAVGAGLAVAKQLAGSK